MEVAENSYILFLNNNCYNLVMGFRKLAREFRDGKRVLKGNKSKAKSIRPKGIGLRARIKELEKEQKIAVSMNGSNVEVHFKSIDEKGNSIRGKLDGEPLAVKKTLIDAHNLGHIEHITIDSLMAAVENI